MESFVFSDAPKPVKPPHERSGSIKLAFSDRSDPSLITAPADLRGAVGSVTAEFSHPLREEPSPKANVRILPTPFTH